MLIARLAIVAALTVPVAGCLTVQQQQSLIATGCDLATTLYNKQTTHGPKTTADYNAAMLICAGAASPLYATLADAIAAFNYDAAKGGAQ